MNIEWERRIAGLEKSRTLLAWGLAIAIAVLVIGATSRREPSEVVKAQRIELLDEGGNVRAVLGIDADGAAGLFVHDSSGGLRISLTDDPDQSALFIRDSAGTARIGVAQFAHGGGGLALHGEDSKGAAVLYYKRGGSLTFYDEQGGVTTRVPPKAAAE